MVDPTTPNLVLAQPIRGSDVGTWDTPVNNNTGVIDQAFGGVTTVALSSIDVTLTSSQAQTAVIRLTGTLTSNVIVNLPSIYKGWTIDNQITNSPSSFAARINSTSATFTIGVAPGVNDIFYDGTSIQYRNLGRVGEYWDYAASTVPTWVGLCTKPPWLNCNGTTFSSATYPILTNLLGTTTLPDSRGRSRYALNQGVTRISTAGAGLDGNTIYAAGGSNGVTLVAGQIPSGVTSVNTAQNISVNTVDYVITQGTQPFTSGTGGGTQATYAIAAGAQSVHAQSTGSNSITVTSTNASVQLVGNAAPSYVGGITMIRAA